VGSKSSGEIQETPQQRAQAEHALNLLADYKTRWLPVQQKLAATIERQGAPGSEARSMAEGRSSTDTAIAFDRGNQQLEKQLSNSGVAPGSARANLAVSGMGNDQAASTGIGQMISNQQIDDAYTQGLSALTALGRGERAQVGSSMANMAATSATQAAQDARTSLAEQSGNAMLGGQLVGFGIQRGLSGLTPNTGMGVTSSTQMPSLGIGAMYPSPQAGP
jgi:hypothetical protein